jgi:hypothetical protein
MRTLIFIASLIIAFTSQAALYKWVDENGEVIYSDQPPTKDAKELVPPPIMSTPAVKYTPKQKPEEKTEEEVATTYTEFKITSPAQDETIRDNAGNISLTLSIAPALNTKQGHSISVLVDGKAKLSNSKNLSHTLTYIDRGTHTLKAEIKDAKGSVIKSSNSVTIHLHRVSALHKKPQQTAPFNTPSN